MIRKKVFGALALTLALGVAACDDAQQAEDAAAPGDQQMAPQQQMDPEAAQQLMELQTIQQQLQPVQEQALQQEDLAMELTAIQEQVATAMREENPEAVARIEELQQEMQSAQAEGDQARMQSLIVEAQGMEQEVRELQSSVMERPEIRDRIDAFETAQRERMIEIDPEVEPLLDRRDEIIAQLSS